jgi:hypothetical protein
MTLVLFRTRAPPTLAPLHTADQGRASEKALASLDRDRRRKQRTPSRVARAPMAGYAPLTRQACFLVPLRDVHALHHEPQAK